MSSSIWNLQQSKCKIAVTKSQIQLNLNIYRHNVPRAQCILTEIVFICVLYARLKRREQRKSVYLLSIQIYACHFVCVFTFFLLSFYLLLKRTGVFLISTCISIASRWCLYCLFRNPRYKVRYAMCVCLLSGCQK